MAEFVRKHLLSTSRLLICLLAFTGLAEAGDPLPASQVLVEAALSFSMERDTLYFVNKEPSLSSVGVPLLGDYGVQEGVCQGIAGIAAAFRENVVFVPSGLRESPAVASARIDEAVRAHQNRSGAKVRIPGFDSLNAYCGAHRDVFLKKSIWLNAQIALDEILPVYGQFRRLKKMPLRESPDFPTLRRELHEQFSRVFAELRNGRYPLLLFHSHVVLVRSYRELRDPDGQLRIELEVYDSNTPTTTRTMSFPLDRDGFPSGDNRMHWVISPA